MKPFEQQSYYELLEVPANASEADIRAAYQRQMEMYAPDSIAVYALADPGQLEALRERLTEAMEFLTDPDLRVEYDRTVGVSERVSGTSATSKHDAKSRAAEALATAADALATAAGAVDAVRTLAPESAPEGAVPKPVAASVEAPVATAAPVAQGAEASAAKPVATATPEARSDDSASSQGATGTKPPAASAPVSVAGVSVVEAFRSSFSRGLSFVYVPAPQPSAPQDASAPVAKAVSQETGAEPQGRGVTSESSVRGEPARTSASTEPIRTAESESVPTPAAETGSTTSTEAEPHGAAAAAVTPVPVAPSPEPVRSAPPAPAPVPSSDPVDPVVPAPVASSPEPVRASTPAPASPPPEPVSPAVPAPVASSAEPTRSATSEPAREEAPAPAIAASVEKAVPSGAGATRPAGLPSGPRVPVRSVAEPASSSHSRGAVSRAGSGRALGDAEVIAQDSAISTAESALAQVAARVREARPRGLDIPPDAEFNGELLRRVREARGLSLQQVADRTRISRHHLENVEADSYGALPTTVYLRGILMNLSRELGLDPLRVSKSYLALSSEKAGKGGR
ncbi:helix-turn-helix domain-containing protein [Myxococcaceae bacterium JPH2]|nr:helix-turn-helix domain-containing protein [Myxococcaceae bacterium JPH2]